MAEINVPAPKAMMMPMVLLLRENLAAITPPTIKEDVANKPQNNEFNMRIDVKSTSSENYINLLDIVS